MAVRRTGASSPSFRWVLRFPSALRHLRMRPLTLLNVKDKVEGSLGRLGFSFVLTFCGGEDFLPPSNGDVSLNRRVVDTSSSISSLSRALLRAPDSSILLFFSKIFNLKFNGLKKVNETLTCDVGAV